MMAIFKANLQPGCDPETAGSEGDLELWVFKCSKSDEFVGWDGTARVLLQREQLYQRVPRLRPAPPAGSGR
jgi:hypothetical protein